MCKDTEIYSQVMCIYSCPYTYMYSHVYKQETLSSVHVVKDKARRSDIYIAQQTSLVRFNFWFIVYTQMSAHVIGVYADRGESACLEEKLYKCMRVRKKLYVRVFVRVCVCVCVC